MSEVSEAERLARRGVTRVRAPNPGPLTLSGTNSWVLGRDPAWVIDPGPAIGGHVTALTAEVDRRGGLGGVALTHEHSDHVAALDALLSRFAAPVAAARDGADVALADGVRFGPLRALSTPGHAPDHYAFVLESTPVASEPLVGSGRRRADSHVQAPGRGKLPASDDAPAPDVGAGVCFTGDAILGEGSVFIAPDPGALAAYLTALERLRELPLAVLCPGHGPPVWQPRAWISAYLEHRLERERRLLDALAQGRRTTAELLDAAWSEVPELLRAAAAVTLRAHLDKLADEGRLPSDVERTGG